jgi:hypothetical protein
MIIHIVIQQKRLLMENLFCCLIDFNQLNVSMTQLLLFLLFKNDRYSSSYL